MKKLALFSLAAGVAFVPAAAAAMQIVNAPVGQDVPRVGLRGPAGTSWQAGAANRAAAVQPVRMHSAPAAGAAMRQRGGDRLISRGAMKRNGYANYHRIDRGNRVHRYWFGPRYQVRNWGMYGFPQPMQGRRWVRYYDDALLIDRDGTVHDGRWDMDWDRYGDRWGYDASGVPAYRDDEDYDRDDGDYGRDDYVGRGDHHGGYDYDEGEADDLDDGHGGGYDDRYEEGTSYKRRYYQKGYGYGYGYAWPGVVTETTVTIKPKVIEETTYVEQRSYAPKKRVHKPKKRMKTKSKGVKYAPYPGERG